MSPKNTKEDAPEQPAEATEEHSDEDPDEVETVRGAPDRVMGPGSAEEDED